MCLFVSGYIYIYILIECTEHAKLEERTGRRSQGFWSLFQHGDSVNGLPDCTMCCHLYHSVRYNTGGEVRPHPTGNGRKGRVGWGGSAVRGEGGENRGHRVIAGRRLSGKGFRC